MCEEDVFGQLSSSWSALVPFAKIGPSLIHHSFWRDVRFLEDGHYQVLEIVFPRKENHLSE